MSEVTDAGSHPAIFIVGGIGLALIAKAVLSRVLLAKLRKDVRDLNRGEYSSMLSAYSDEAILRFNQGPHRWSGEHRGKWALEQFFANFVGAGLQGEIKELYATGPLWRLTLIARFDDHAADENGTAVYSNRTVIIARIRWGRIVEHDDFYEDTGRIAAFENDLRSRGIPAAGG